MKLSKYALKAPFRVIKLQKKRSTIKLKQSMLRLKYALNQEKIETKQMLTIYRRYTKNQASKEEMQIAHKQFADLLKGIGIGVVAVLPFAPITLPIFIKLGKMVGVDILPSAFSNVSQAAKQKD